MGFDHQHHALHNTTQRIMDSQLNKNEEVLMTIEKLALTLHHKQMTHDPDFQNFQKLMAQDPATKKRNELYQIWITQMTWEPDLRNVRVILQRKVRNSRGRDIVRGFYDPDNHITAQHLANRTLDQGMLCAWCLVHMSLERNNKQITVDRIDNNKGHTIDNIVMACLHCNTARYNQ
jgi:hypothetical protein